MSTVVVDSGALVDVLLTNGEQPVAATGPLAGHDLVAPHLIDVEVLNTTRKLLLRDEVSRDYAEALLRDYKRTVIEMFPHKTLIEKAWVLRENITPYDAMYVALAQTLDVPLITTDARLARAARIHCTVELLD